MNPLLALNQRDQFVWLDHISRSLIADGVLHRLIKEDGLGGVTSNPTIFDKAIAGSTDYDAGLSEPHALWRVMRRQWPRAAPRVGAPLLRWGAR